MKKTNLILPAIILVAVGLRIALPYSTVFGEYTKFTSPDAYYHMGIITKIAPVFPVALQQYQLWDWLVAGLAWLLAWGNPTKEFVEHVAVFVPPMLAGFTILFVYIMGSRLFNCWAGLVAALTTVFIPGEFWYRSLLGDVDHHVAEVCFTTGAITFLVLSLRTYQWQRWLYTVGFVAFTAAYIWTWPGYALFVMIFGGALLIIWITWLYRKSNKIIAFVVSLASTMLCIYLAFYFDQIDMIVAGASMNKLTLSTTSEAISAFSIVGLVGLTLPKCVLVLLLLIPLVLYKELGSIRWLIVIWALVIVGATLWQRRFDYYLVVPLALLAGYAVWRLYEYLNKEGVSLIFARNFILVCLAFLLLCSGLIIGLNSGNYFTPSDDWQETLIWVRDNTPEDALIIAWWDYGYWIEYIAEREAACNNSQSPDAIRKVADILVAGNGLPDRSDVYLILNRELITLKMGAVIAWHGQDAALAETFAMRLYRVPDGYDGYKCVHHTPTVSVYRVK